MHPLFAQASGLTHEVIGAAIEVHKDKGPGLLESIYEWCLTMEYSPFPLFPSVQKMSRK
jgi:GxxExxY protein